MTAGPGCPGAGPWSYQPTTVVVAGTWALPSVFRPSDTTVDCTPMEGIATWVGGVAGCAGPVKARLRSTSCERGAAATTTGGVSTPWATPTGPPAGWDDDMVIPARTDTRATPTSPAVRSAGRDRRPGSGESDTQWMGTMTPPGASVTPKLDGSTGWPSRPRRVARRRRLTPATMAMTAMTTMVSPAVHICSDPVAATKPAPPPKPVCIGPTGAAVTPTASRRISTLAVVPGPWTTASDETLPADSFQLLPT